MILVSTHAKLAPDAIIYRAATPAFTIQGVEIPAAVEHFVDKKAAERAASRFAPNVVGIVTPVKASEFNPWEGR